MTPSRLKTEKALRKKQAEANLERNLKFKAETKLEDEKHGMAARKEKYDARQKAKSGVVEKE